MTTSQLTLLETPITTMPLREALELVANQWSRRLGYPVHVTGNPWHGYQIEPERNPA